MFQNSPNCLKRTISALAGAGEGSLSAADAAIRWDESIRGSILPEYHELSHQSVLIATTDQFTAALLLLELDGVAARLVLYPPDMSFEHLAHVARVAAVDVIV